MSRATMVGWAFAAVLVLLAVGFGYVTRNEVDQLGRAAPASNPPSTTPTAGGPAAGTHPAAETQAGFLYGRVTTTDGTALEGRLRFGGDQEAFWGNYFNGSKHENTWLPHLTPEARPKENDSIELFGLTLVDRQRPSDVARQLVTPFGELARIESRGREVLVTLKSGSVFDLDRFEASDFDDGVRVWDDKGGVVDLDSGQIRSIELLPTPSLDGAPYRLHGTVRARQGEFTGFVAWNREDSVGTDELDGRTTDGELSVRFDTIRSIERRSRDSLVTLLDGSEIALSGGEVGGRNRGIYVDDPRYGRVLVSWNAFERIDFGPGGSGPAYDDFPPGHPLRGSVTTRAGLRFAGRLVYDLDEGETVETLDASSEDLDYAIPFGLVASIVPDGADVPGSPRATVSLQNGEVLQLDRTGDLGGQNAGMLIFVDGRERPEYVPWADVRQVDFDRPPAMDPPLAGR